MNAFSRGKQGLKSIYVPTQFHGLVQRSTGSSDAKVVRAMKRMVVDLADRERWTVLEALRENRKWLPPGTTSTTKLTLSHVYSYYASNRLETLEGLLSSKNLAEYLSPWIQWVRANRQEGVRTAEVYWQQVTTLVPEAGSFLASQLTKESVKTWLAGRGQASSGTRRKYLYALKSFIAYLLDAAVLETDPLAGMKAPKKNPARERWETEANDRRLVDASSPKYRALFATVKGVGCDLSSAIARAQKGDFDLARGTMNVRGTKTDRRKVHAATIEPWAIPYIAAHLKTIVGDHTPVFAHLSRHGAAQHHLRCCQALGIQDYTLKDARHSVGVRMRLRGEDFEKIAEQLGTSVFQAVTVYTRYKPEQAAQAKEGTNG